MDLPHRGLEIVKVWSEDGAGKVLEVPADMTARDVCQLLVYKSHCVDDNAWTLVEHHPILGLDQSDLMRFSSCRLRSRWLPWEPRLVPLLPSFDVRCGEVVEKSWRSRGEVVARSNIKVKPSVAPRTQTGFPTAGGGGGAFR
ncbi:Growth factor receptor-bound protein 10 [Liparis tanakae]|uniref:Growth factor receptor-bound protein 10 n=1 Tax=Liparis tanakae TaxID=230148 RepID=A0A4Z2GMW4_9TELE|nr:Growth factor receptor-bound protein 10 [Liparis tanakae]